MRTLEGATRAACAALCLVASNPVSARASTYDLLYSFAPGANGQSPSVQLVQGPPGVLYGATSAGGTNGQGVLYSYTIASQQEAPLYSFANTGGAGTGALAVGTDGSLYGTLQFDPQNSAIFRLIPATGAYSTLYTFNPADDSTIGFDPGAIAVDRNGTLFAQTLLGGPGDSGTLFQLDNKGKVHVLLAFTNGGASVPGRASLIGSALYGVICEQNNETGSVYKIPTATGVVKTLYQFTGGRDGGCPRGVVAADGSGGIDGFTSAGGKNGAGVLYRVNALTGAETVLFDLPANFGDGLTAILPGRDGVIYGIRNSPGGVFAFDTNKQKMIQLGGVQGKQDLPSAEPLPGLIEHSRFLYGVTLKGGSTNVGTIFRVSR